MKTHRTFISLGLLFLASFSVQGQQRWSFDTDTPLLSTDWSLHLSMKSSKKSIELVEGMVGNGVRTDGYSTWFELQSEPFPVTGISGWFALESFPTDTASFYGVRNSRNETVSLCVDRFGSLVVGIGTNGAYHYIPTHSTVSRFEWLHLGMRTEKDQLEIYLNGNKVKLGQGISTTLSPLTGLLLGRDYREKRLGIHGLTAINGIIDEICLHAETVLPAEWEKETAQSGHKKPRLAIPESRFVNDFSRPKYHLLPAANWTNETHGLLLYNNKYHIFNQKNASNMFLGQINWGHFSSDDLVNWTEHKPALSPEPGYDKNGNWSGHAVINDEGVPTLIYTTGGDKLGVGLAYPVDKDLVEWKKYEKNPVIDGQPEGFSRTDPRDQYVWKEGDTWYMIIGYGVVQDEVEKGAVLLYTSKDMKQWKFLHTLFEGNPQVDNSGIFWEMPVFFKTNGKYVLLVNKVPHKGVPARALYWVGDFKNERFIPDSPTPQNLEVINRLLSPSLTWDKDGNITTIAIIPDEIGSRAAYAHGWTHLYSIPRVWKLRDGKIEQQPHPALKQLRDESHPITPTAVKENSPLLIHKGDQQLELKMTIQPGDAKRYGFLLHKNADHSEYSLIYYDCENQQIVVDQLNSSRKAEIPLHARKDKYVLTPGAPVDFHLFIDGSVVEVFINGQDAFTTRIFPLQQESNQVEVFTIGGDIHIKGDVWKLQPASMLTDF